VSSVRFFGKVSQKALKIFVYVWLTVGRRFSEENWIPWIMSNKKVDRLGPTFLS